MTFLQVALNGDRRHGAAPRGPDAIGDDAAASVRAGAHSVHVHAYDRAGNETLNAAECSAVIRAIRARCPDVPISLTTSATIVPDPVQRLQTVQSWTDFPDLVTANQGEKGITELGEWLILRGVGIEAGLLSPADAHAFVASPLRDRCRRVLIEPLDPDPVAALRDAEEMEAILSAAGIALPQVHHGYDGSCWAVNKRALARGHGIRTGMEDVTILPDGRAAKSNAELVEAARLLIENAIPRT
ncbi:3-keto-5-aminohexanoate cleavage protein [Burkholderia ubonensis]|uniref:Aldolase n=1 Tax=Burkholderia ubonensis TaxID=101571 RepID=A0A107FT95_9BURK|nr:3-keto-5-aminohexanoate cleavage protein [Burkholderia ubonensis]KWD88173.1 aldolase [Burkholderia ubonensis]KWD89251.1 aldolase [Burkholderia ubonensis]KWD99254.1 aldolase [Burkholderia ubonensis]KWE01539.1 aldolase [Burkholderia ubonensis]KWN10894.1 aldolase [Burkholderia ubonensis]